MLTKSEKHKHKMESITTDKVTLWKTDNLNGKTERILARGYDLFTYKQCECGFKSPIKVERTVL